MPVTPAGPDHNKSLEKSELYPPMFQSPDPTKAMSTTSALNTQIYANNFPAARSNDAYRYGVCCAHLFFLKKVL